MLIFTTQEQILLCIYDAGSRAGTLAQLRDMMGELTDEEQELRTMAESAISKLRLMMDAEYTELFHRGGFPCLTSHGLRALRSMESEDEPICAARFQGYCAAGQQRGHGCPALCF